jgi:hypothetical protein
VGPEGGPQSCIPLVESIVPHLASHAGLRRLDLGDAASAPFSEPDWDLLLSTLEHLSIAGYYFDETSFPPFIKALQSNTTVARLTLSNGRLSSQAGLLLGTSVNREANRNGNKVSELELYSIYGNLNVTSILIGFYRNSNLAQRASSSQYDIYQRFADNTAQHVSCLGPMGSASLAAMQSVGSSATQSVPPRLVGQRQ